METKLPSMAQGILRDVGADAVGQSTGQGSVSKNVPRKAKWFNPVLAHIFKYMCVDMWAGY